MINETECSDYIDHVLGQREQIAARFNIKEGTDCMLERLDKRFGVHGRLLYVELLRRHLHNVKGTSVEDRKLWRQWRADFEVTGVSTSIQPL